MVAYLAPWVMFVITGAAWWAWAAIAVLMVGIPFGERMMRWRSRSARGQASPGSGDYVRAVADVFAGRLPPRVTFHAIFSAAVFFGSLGVAVGATVTAVS
jgi:hypothetical protein